MSRAEELARQQYPDKEGTEGICTTWLQRNAYKKGYQQAEKDFMEKAEKWFESEFRLNDAPYKEMLIRRFKQAMNDFMADKNINKQ